MIGKNRAAIAVSLRGSDAGPVRFREVAQEGQVVLVYRLLMGSSSSRQQFWHHHH